MSQLERQVSPLVVRVPSKRQLQATVVKEDVVPNRKVSEAFEVTVPLNLDKMTRGAHQFSSSNREHHKNNPR